MKRAWMAGILVMGLGAGIGRANLVTLLDTYGATTAQTHQWTVTTAFADGASQSAVIALGIYLDNDNAPISQSGVNQDFFTVTPEGGSASDVVVVGQDVRMALAYVPVANGTTYTFDLGIGTNGFSATPISVIAYQVESDSVNLVLRESAIAYDPANPAVIPTSTSITTTGRRGIVGFGFNDRTTQTAVVNPDWTEDFDADLQFVDSLGVSISNAGVAGGTYVLDADWIATNERRVGTGILAFQGIPEPGSVALIGLGGLLLAWVRRRR